MILELDVGNTRIKWRRLEERSGSVLEQGHVAESGELVKIFADAPAPRMIRMCSVRGGEVSEQLKRWAVDNWQLEIHSAEVSRSCAGVTNQYTDLGKLGVDRWLAMLAAYRRAAGSCIIVDSGTALTIDVVDADGNHVGGYIIPGLQLMRESLQANTRIRLIDEPECSLALGHSTDTAVYNGTLAALVAVIERVVHSVAGANLYLSGGDAELLQSQLHGLQAEVVTGLVLDGLSLACPYEP